MLPCFPARACSRCRSARSPSPSRGASNSPALCLYPPADLEVHAAVQKAGAALVEAVNRQRPGYLLLPETTLSKAATAVAAALPRLQEAPFVVASAPVSWWFASQVLARPDAAASIPLTPEASNLLAAASLGMRCRRPWACTMVHTRASELHPGWPRDSSSRRRDSSSSSSSSSGGGGDGDGGGDADGGYLPIKRLLRCWPALDAVLQADLSGSGKPQRRPVQGKRLPASASSSLSPSPSPSPSPSLSQASGRTAPSTTSSLVAAAAASGKHGVQDTKQKKRCKKAKGSVQERHHLHALEAVRDAVLSALSGTAFAAADDASPNSRTLSQQLRVSGPLQDLGPWQPPSHPPGAEARPSLAPAVKELVLDAIAACYSFLWCVKNVHPCVAMRLDKSILQQVAPAVAAAAAAAATVDAAVVEEVGGAP